MNDVYEYHEELDEDPCTGCPYYVLSGDICLRVQQGKNCYYIDECFRILNNMKSAYEEMKYGKKIDTSGHCKSAEWSWPQGLEHTNIKD